MDEVYGGTDPYAKSFWPEVHPSDTHAVLYELPLLHDGMPPRPHKSRTTWKWDQTHVRFPCSPESQYPVRKSDGSSEVVNRWELIETALLGRPITTSQDLELAIFSYNSKYAKSWCFRGLHAFFNDELDEHETDLFFSNMLPKIINLALQLPTLVPSSIPLLKCGQNMSISMTQQQIACLMANAFLCTFPRRNTQKMNSEYKHFPDINFNRLFQSTQSSVMEKLKCVCHYFRRVTSEFPPIGVVTFRRRSLPPKCIPKFSESDSPISRCHLVVRSSGTIESDGKGLLQVDFANKRIGGGVLGQGCVQEEIRFMICPELLITRLFTEVLRPDEALFVIGAEQFSLYTGYASSFEWAGNYSDPTPLDGNQRRQCQIVAIDALPFQDPRHQYRPELMQRELTKAYVGYARLQQQQRVAPGVASGNWGCGAFNGNAHLKSLLQVMICAIAERPLVYFTFGDRTLVGELEGMYGLLCRKQVTVGQLWRILLRFSEEEKKGRSTGEELFEFIKKELDGKERKMAALFSFNPKNVPKNTAPKEGDSSFKFGFGGGSKPKEQEREKSKKTIDYSDTDDEMQVDQQKKKKLTSPEGNGGGREKMARMSLADCLESYFKKDSGQKSSSSEGASCSKTIPVASEMMSSNCTVVKDQDQEEEKKKEEEKDYQEEEEVAVEERKENEPFFENNSKELVEEEQENEQKQKPQAESPKLDFIVQIDEEGGEYIDSSQTEQSPKDSHYTGRQTKLMDFFKMKSVKK